MVRFIRKVSCRLKCGVSENVDKVSCVEKAAAQRSVLPVRCAVVARDKVVQRPDLSRIPLLQNILTEAVQDRCCLCACGVALGHQVPVAAILDALAADPLHSGERVLGDIQCIVVAEDIGVLAHADIQLLHEGAIQEGHHLGAGTGIIRTEGGGAGTTGDLLLVSPLDGNCVILV